MDRRNMLLIGAVILGIGAVIYVKRRKLSASGEAAVANPNAFVDSIPDEAKTYAEIILQVAGETGVDPFLIAAVGQRESRWGLALDANMTGDAGHGHGIMQIDDRTWASWIASNDWTDPYTNVKKGAEILASNLSYFEGKGLTGNDLIAAAAAGYNHGPGAVWRNVSATGNPDDGPGGPTAHGDYGRSVLASSSSYAVGFEVA